MPSQARPISLLCAVGLCLGLGACGDSASTAKKEATRTTSAQSSTQAASAQPRRTYPAGGEDAATVILPRGAGAKQVVASVAGEPITAAEVEHWMATKSPNAPVPDPPQYTACIAGQKQEGAAKTPSAAPQSEPQLRLICQERYEEQLRAALGVAIHNRWLTGEAAEEGISVSSGEVRQALQVARKSFSKSAEFEAYLKGSGLSVKQFKAELKINKIADEIFAHIKKLEHATNSADVARYYSTHRQQFSTPAGRQVRIVRTATEASALKAKQELQSGKSFQSVAKGLSAIGQPITAKNGEVANLKPNLFGEKSLNDAIFSAKAHRLYGPVKVTAAHKTIAPETNSGFFIFEVVRTVPASRTPLAHVRASLARELRAQEQKENLARFIGSFRRRWRARTDCRPGYVIVTNCKQFKESKAGEAEDLYTL